MIDIGIYVALGFLAASLLALLLVPPLWHRAVRLTTKKLETTMPMSVADIQADKDQLRAEYAIRLRRVEMALDKAKDKAIREQVEANKRRVKIAEINADLAAAKATMEESVNANRVLEQTIKKRLPDLDSRLKAAKDVIVELETTNAELRRTTESQAAALKSTRSTAQTQKADITQLRKALEGGTGRARGIGKSEAKEIQLLSAELSRLREELERNRVHREENDALRQELNRLATQILAVAKGQGVDLPHIGEELTPLREVRNLAETVASFAQRSEPMMSEPMAPEPIFPYGNGIEREPEPVFPQESFEPAPEPESVPTFVAMTEEISVDVRLGEPEPEVETELAEPSIEDGFAGSYEEGGHEISEPEPTNGEAHHDDENVAEEETAHEAEPAREDEVAKKDEITPTASDEEYDDSLPKGPLARRLAARRAKRRATKGSGQSLSDRLRGIPAEASDA